MSAYEVETAALTQMSLRQLQRKLAGIEQALSAEQTRIRLAFGACERLGRAIQHLAKPEKGKNNGRPAEAGENDR